MCICGADIGVCTYRPGCQSDDECSGGALCVGALQNDRCSRYPEWEFACQAANDECVLQSECGSWELCVGSDGRQCEDINCE
jgi:hypothetical protein